MNINNVNELFLKFVICADWGIDLNAKIDDIIGASVKKAYSDASRRVLQDMNLKEVEAAQNCIKLSILNFPNVEESDEKYYDAWHKGLCEKVKDIIKTGTFTYGHAQKWINMSIKYVWLLTKVVETKEYLKILEYENHFHIPLDSYILEGLKTKFEENDSNKIDNNRKLITGGGESYYLKNIESKKEEAWSKISTYEAYMYLQEKIREEILKKEMRLPLEYENDLWIEISLKRKSELVNSYKTIEGAEFK